MPRRQAIVCPVSPGVGGIRNNARKKEKKPYPHNNIAIARGATARY